MTKHTAGPWKHNGLDYIHAKNEYGEMEVVAHIDSENPDSVYCRDEEEAMANAKLIEAAPLLLAALIRLRDEVKDDSPDMWNQVEDAISAATDG